MDDNQILAMLWDRDTAALDRLSEQFGRRLLQLAYNVTHDQQDAQECVNDTYLAIWNSIPPKRPMPLLPYALRLCKNISITRFRSAKAKKRVGYEVALDELSEAIGIASLDEKLDAQQLGQAVDAFLATLSKENRVIFLKRYWYGDSISHIAKQVSMAENAVSVRLHRTRKELKEYLIKEGFYER